MSRFYCIISHCFFFLAISQAQTIKGTILDHQSQMSIIGASVTVFNSNPLKGAVTDLDGNFMIPDCPLGRQIVVVSYVGYKSESIEVIVSNGKEAVVQLSLEEDQETLQAVEIVAQKKTSNVNKLAKISANALNMSTVTRISGGRSDISRFVSSFAGVATQGDSKNDITVRGNSSNGILWRLDGMPIANPNHFALFGTTSGSFSALNPNMLAQSDFLTGAFPAEYGNALSGVMDLQLKVGNKERHEFTTQLSAWSGVEVQAEGPVLKKLNGSYALAYRYSFVDILRRVGYTPNGDASPQYSDLCYNLDFHKKRQHFNVFGIVGMANLSYNGSESAAKTEGRPVNEYVDYHSKMKQFGFRHQWLIDSSSYWKNIFYVGNNNLETERGLDKGKPNEELDDLAENKDNSWRFSSQYNKRWTKKLSMRAGYVWQNTSFSTFYQSRLDNQQFFTFRNSNDALTLHEAYIQLQYKVKKRYSINTGLHAQYSPFTKHYILEPRGALKLKLANKNDLVLAYGLHSQLPLLNVLFYANAKGILPNHQLDFLRSHHFVLGWDKKMPRDWRFHAETYFQYLTHVPIQKSSPTFSVLNYGSDNNRTNYDSLTNDGLGRNYGIELSLSRTYANGFYTTINTSLFQSQYRSADNVWRNTAFNNRYILTVLAGKEFPLKRKHRVLTVDTKINAMGGAYYTPIDLKQSIASNYEVLDYSQAFANTTPSIFQWDVRLGFRKDGKRLTQTFFLDLTNINNRGNIASYYYDSINQVIAPRYRNLGILPDVMYRLQF